MMLVHLITEGLAQVLLAAYFTAQALNQAQADQRHQQCENPPQDRLRQVMRKAGVERRRIRTGQQFSRRSTGSTGGRQVDTQARSNEVKCDKKDVIATEAHGNTRNLLLST